MKKKVLKGLLATCVVGGVFVSGVYAGSYLEQINAYLNKGITLSYNGVNFYPTEDDGTRVYPITYNGRTYVPAKFIAEKAGLGVEWQEDTLTVAFTSADYVPPTVTKGTYKKLGSGQLKFLTDNFEELTEYGFDVEETLATSNYGTHKGRAIYSTNNPLVKRQVHIAYVEKLKEGINKQEWNLVSSVSLDNGHYKNVYTHKTQPLKFENYSTDEEIVFLASRTDMNNNNSVIENTVQNNNQISTSSYGYFEGYFSSVPKPRLDNSWREEISREYKDWSIKPGDNAYILDVDFETDDDSKVDAEFEKYKNDLLNEGFKFYESHADHYTYIKNDISITIFAGYDYISVDLASGYQADHL